MSNQVRVRYAPSPTGELHIGNARTALFNYLFARHHKGTFILRTEDTDTKRNLAHGEESQFRNLKWLGMDWDEGPDMGGPYGPYRQSERKHLYDPLIQQLLDEDKAYKCYMTEEELEAEREEQRARGEMPHYAGKHAHLTKEQQEAFEAEGRIPSVRFRVPKNETYEFDDMVKGPISFDSSSVSGDWVIKKKDGMPTYNFAVVVDDHYMEITHVLRGDDHIANTPRQMMIYDALGWEAPRFGHMTLITNSETGRKLSKRDGHIIQFIEQYKDLGYLPEALFNFIALLGWSPQGEEEIFSHEELIEIFDENRLSTSPAAFDAQKLDWVSNEYIKATPLETIVELCLPHLIEAKLIPADLDAEMMEWVTKLVGLYQEQLSHAAQIVELSQLFFNDELSLDQSSQDEIDNDTAPVVIAAIKEKLAALPEEDFTANNIRPMIQEIQKETEIRGRKLFMPIRIAVSGQMSGPEVPDLIELLGKEKALDHIEQVQAYLD